MKNQQIRASKATYEFILGPVKIKDGLFMGDELAAKDIEFIINNKVTHIINTVSKQIPNLWERYGIQYLSVNWTEKQQNIFDKKNNALNAIFHFIEQAMEQGQSCLVHSVNGKSRACTVIVAYMMKKLNWSLDKCLQFVNTKKEQLQIRNGYLVQLQQLEKRLSQIYNLTMTWHQTKNDQDLILKNTFLNSKAAEVAEKTPIKTGKKKISWAEKPIINARMASTTTASFTKIRQKDKEPPRRLKSILKGDQQHQSQDDQTNQAKTMKDSNFNINGNIVHVTVNNFITTDKKHDSASKTVANTRPFSSDNKERQKKHQMNRTTGKMFPYDNIITNFKSPYDNKLGSNNKLHKKKQDQYRSPLMTYERPQSANIAAERRKIKNPNFLKKEEMIVTGKKRYPSTNPRDELYKWK